MKAQILKIAGVKSEKEFYKKYPSEEAFMKKHGKEFKKAQMGAIISGGGKTSNPKMINYQDMYDQSDKTVTGMTDAMRLDQALKLTELNKQNAPASSEGGGGMGNMIGSLGKLFGGEGMEDMEGMEAVAKYGTNIPKAYNGTNANNWWSSMTTDITTTLPPEFNINQYGIGAQTMGKMQGEQNSSNTVGTPVDTSKENWMFKDTSGAPYADSKINQNYKGYQGEVPEEQSGLDKIMGGISKYSGPAGKLYEGYQQLRAQRRARKEAEQQKVVSDIALKASETRPEEIKRRYVRPEDIQNTGEEFFPIYGVGTNPLARNGMRLQGGGMIGGNPTEIQNTYGDGNSIYDNLEYEPLINVNQQKSYRQGGMLYQFENGGAAAGGGTPWGSIGSLATNMGQTAMGGQNAGGNIGSTIGSTVGMLGGPIGSAVGQFVGGIAGNILDKNPKRTQRFQKETQRNITKMGLNSGFQSVNAGNASYVRDGGDIPNYEYGGYMNPEYNPQVIAKFGDLDDQDYARFAQKDQFRAGGHLKAYREPSERAMQTYEYGGEVKSYGLGGELETHWGGGAETMSYNPYLPGTGETVMFRGKSHEEYSPNGETGIGVTYGGNPVEVERGEPMVELEDGGVVDPMTGEPQKSGVVFGNLKIPNQYIDLLGDKNAKGKKFKNYVADLSKTEAKQNKLIEKSTTELNNLNVKNSFDRLKLSSLQANIEGGNLKLKDIADKKINAASLQNAINDTAEENRLVADDLAKGKVKIDKEAMTTREARLGATIDKFQVGGYKTKGKGEKWNFTQAGETNNPLFDDSQRYENEWTPSVNKALSDKERAQRMLKYIETYSGEGSTNIKKALNKIPSEEEKIMFLQQQATNKQVGPIHHVVDAAIKFTEPSITTLLKENEKDEVDQKQTTQPIPYKRSILMDLGNQALEYLRPSNQEALDMAQLYPEMYAMSSNQLEPVPTQGYQPELGVPYDISLQDQLNANQADYRAAQRMMGYNPAAQANLNAQKYQANQGILGNQFRANQAMRDKVYSENRNILNQANLANLNIYDKQYERQAQALSNTKATTQAALNSIADKYAKNKLENRTLGVYENLYKYRYDNSGRAINMNPLFQPNIPTVGSVDGTQKQVPVKDADGNILYYQLEEENNNKRKPSIAGPGIVAKSGKSIVKKNNKNSSIVKAIKNL
jgi:predicted DNA binding CopG/RHH family protein